MATDLEIFEWVGMYGSGKSFTPNLLTADFGDGYSQDIPNGINSTPQTVALTFQLSWSDAQDCYAFLKRQGGSKRFWLTLPDEVDPIKVKTVGEVKQEWTNWGWCTITASFKQQFDPD
jgi:phage-related protein